MVQRMHVAWFGDQIPVIPLSVQKIRAIAALFKAGHYSSFSNYASRAKTEHISTFHQHGVPWSEELGVEMKAGARSVVRGKGPAKQSFPVDLFKCQKLGVIDHPVVEGGPLGPTDLVVAGAFFMTRELEVACAKCGHVSFDVLSAEVTWNLPVSKNDTRALGTYRTWGCICGSDLRVGCPYHALLRQLDRVRLASAGNANISDLPLFPDINGSIVAKNIMVASITKLMEKCGHAVTDAMGRPLFGGHSLRTGGAVFLAGMGLDTQRIESMARWNSPMLLYYIRSAPVRSITKEFNLLAKARSDNAVASSSASKGASNPTLAKTMASLINRLDQADIAYLEAEQRIASLEENCAPLKYICNVASGVWHYSRDHAAGKACYTACGWKYTGLQFEVKCALPDGLSHKEVCGTCLPAKRLLAMLD